MVELLKRLMGAARAGAGRQMRRTDEDFEALFQAQLEAFLRGERPEA